MSLIFDSFSSMERAQAFVAKVKERFGLAGQVFDNSDDARQHDFFPGVQQPIIVHIDRPCKIQDDNRMVDEFDGTFIGT